MKQLSTSYLFQLFSVIVIVYISASNLSAEILYADSLLTSGPCSRPHQIYTDAELRSYELPTYGTTTYWMVNSSNLDEEILEDYEFWGLLYNDFYCYYHNAKINVSTELKKKVFENSNLYKEMKDEMDFTRKFLLSDTIYMPLHDFVHYAREYDVNRGGFLVREELCKELPPFFQKPSNPSVKHNNQSIPLICEPRLPGPDYPKYFVIPKSLKNKFDSAKGKRFSFFIPIANEEIALEIENMNRAYDKNFDLILQFHYIQKPEPIVELVDIILLSNKDNRVIWTLSKGDLSVNETYMNSFRQRD